MQRFDMPARLCSRVVETARLMVGVPDYQAYVARHRHDHPGEAPMTYEQFFRERQSARYAFDKGRMRGCG